MFLEFIFQLSSDSHLQNMLSSLINAILSRSTVSREMIGLTRSVLAFVLL